MHPVLYDIHGFKIYTYGPIMAIGFLMAFFLMYHLAKKREEDVEFYMDLYIWLIIFGLLGSKLLYNFLAYQEFLDNPTLSQFFKMMNCRNGGLVWYGGVVMNVFFVTWYARRKGIPVLQVMDTLVAPLALGLAIGRWGCLMGGCCYGKACDLPWHIMYPAGANPVAGTYVHPTPIYESLASLLICGVIYAAVTRKMRRGGPTLLWFTLYPLARFFIEFFRGDEIRGFIYQGQSFSISTSQFIGLLVFLAACGFWVRFFLTRGEADVVPSKDKAKPAAKAPGGSGEPAKKTKKKKAQ